MRLSNSTLSNHKSMQELLCCFFWTRIQYSPQAHSWIRGSSILSLLQTPTRAEFHLELATGGNWSNSPPRCLSRHWLTAVPQRASSPHIFTRRSLGSEEKWITTIPSSLSFNEACPCMWWPLVWPESLLRGRTHAFREAHPSLPYPFLRLRGSGDAESHKDNQRGTENQQGGT